MCHDNQRVKQKFVFLDCQISDVSNELALWQIVKIESKIIKVELKTCDKVEVLAYFWYNLIILVLKYENNTGDHGLMHGHDSQLKAPSVDLFA